MGRQAGCFDCRHVFRRALSRRAIHASLGKQAYPSMHVIIPLMVGCPILFRNTSMGLHDDMASTRSLIELNVSLHSGALEQTVNIFIH